MGDSGLLAAIAQWLSAFGIPGLAGLWYRQVQWNHRQDLAIQALETRLADYVALSAQVNTMSTTMTEIRVIVGQLKDESDRNRRMAERRRTDEA